jgi:hypothetical protein
MVRNRQPPSQTWRTFLANQLGQVVAADFLVVPTATCRLLFVLVLLAHERRRVVHVAVTDHPTRRGPRYCCARRFRGTRRRDIYSEIAITRSTPGQTPRRRWIFTNSSRPHAHRGRTHTSSDLSARFAGSASITSSSAMRADCAASWTCAAGATPRADGITSTVLGGMRDGAAELRLIALDHRECYTS